MRELTEEKLWEMKRSWAEHLRNVEESETIEDAKNSMLKMYYFLTDFRDDLLYNYGFNIKYTLITFSRLISFPKLALNEKTLRTIIGEKDGTLSKIKMKNTIDGVKKIADDLFEDMAHLIVMLEAKNVSKQRLVEKVIDLYGMKIIFDDVPHYFTDISKQVRVPTEFGNVYIRVLNKVYELLKKKNLLKLWYGKIMIKNTDVGKRPRGGKSYNTVGEYYQTYSKDYAEKDAPVGERPVMDDIVLYGSPNDPGDLMATAIHELGHRLYFRFFTKGQREMFDAFFKHEQSSPATTYGGENPQEDFAELFMLYVGNKNLTEGQKAKIERIIQKKDFRIASVSRVGRLSAL